MGRGFFTSTWILLFAGALAACASKSSDQSGYAGTYAKYDCWQLEALRGEGVGSEGDVAGSKVTINVSKRDVADIEAAAKAKGCQIDFRGYRR